MRVGFPQRQSGQAAIESALILPMMVFMVLGIIQLTMVQQAKLMTEYAAYQAARAGSVWNGNNERMQDAAIVALLPTMGRTDNYSELALTFARAKLYDLALIPVLSGGPTPANILGSNLRGQVRVDTVNPANFSAYGSFWKLKQGNNWKELDFDGPDGYPELPTIEAHLAKFFNLPTQDTDEQDYRKATVLQIRLRYLYEMRVPFANHVIFLSWYAANAQVRLSGSIDRSTTTKQNMLGKSGSTLALIPQGKGIKVLKGYDTITTAEMIALYGLADGSIPLVSAAVGKKFFLPLTATYSMRMQSNFHRKWIMHKAPTWSF